MMYTFIGDADDVLELAGGEVLAELGYDEGGSGAGAEAEVEDHAAEYGLDDFIGGELLEAYILVEGGVERALSEKRPLWRSLAAWGRRSRRWEEEREAMRGIRRPLIRFVNT